jgi:LEA14-like dessication related protein
MNVRRKRPLLFLALLPALVGAAGARSAARDVRISVVEKRVQDLSPQGLTLSFILQISNASSQPWLLASYDYRVLVANAEFFRLRRELETPLALAPSGKTFISLPVKITYDYLFQPSPAMRERDRLECTLVGGMFFAEKAGDRGERLNLAMTGDFPVYRGLQTRLLPLEVRALSVGGVDLTFRAEIRNLNAFPLQVRRLSYQLQVGGKEIARGNTAGEKDLVPLAALPFELPLLLEFFEVGPELYPLLRAAAVECRFSGQVLISIPWGEFLIPFDQNEKIPVKKAGEGVKP